MNGVHSRQMYIEVQDMTQNLNSNCHFCLDQFLCFSLFQMFGVQFKLSTEVLGLTLLAWGNSIGGKYQAVKTQWLVD